MKSPQLNKSLLIAVLGGMCSMVLLSCSSSFFSSSSSFKYRYNYVLQYPIESEQLLYRDDSIYVQFRIDEGAVKLQIQNISTTNAEILWDRASLGINNRHYPVKHSRTLYVDSINCGQSTTLAPLGYTVDLVIPAKNVYYDGKKWRELDLIPTEDTKTFSIEQNRDKILSSTITLNLPIRFGERTKEYLFDFIINGIDKIPWSNYQPPRRPPPPPRKGNFETKDQIITAAVLATVIGVTSIFVTQKKVPPTD